VRERAAVGKGGNLMEAMIWVWLAVVVLAIVCEGMTTALVSIWFVPGALIGMIFAALGVEIWIQVLIFIVLSVSLIVVFQRFFKGVLNANDKKKATNLDLVIGKTAVVVEKIDNVAGEGCVKIDGKYWSARTDDGVVVEDGEIVEIVAVSGVKLICRKTNI
jgi:membrane protein implicated in regulation of membrane protease activity